MKKFYAILCIALATLTQLQAQSPQGINYQATVRNSAGVLIVNTNVYFKFNVIQGSQTAVPIFTETHYVPTDDLGQVNLVIGQGTAITGTFSELDWSLGSYYLGIELDAGSGYVAMGTTQLLSVPYALYAENSGNSSPTTPNLEAVLAENNSANTQQIKDLQDPTEAQDAVTKNYVDTEIENNVQNIEQVLIQGNDANGIQLKGLASPTDPQDAVNLETVVSQIEPLLDQIDDLQNQLTDIYQNLIDGDGDGFTPNEGDCDDSNPSVYPNAIEICDGIDNDCDGVIDGGAETEYFIDSDGDGYGFIQISVVACSQPTGNVTNGDDCDDSNSSVYPGATEVEDGIDNDCDGEIDEGLAPGTIIDQDGNPYDYIVYGGQAWTVKNAEMVTYRDGTPIPEVTDVIAWESLTTGAWAYYNNDPTKPRLYNWYAVIGRHDNDPNTPNKEFAPDGWHVPSDAEWTTLENYLIANGYNYDGTTTENKIAKAMASTTGWNNYTDFGAPGNNQSLNNSSWFNVFPEGARSSNGSFYNEGINAIFWSSTEFNTDIALNRALTGYWSYLYSSGSVKRFGFSVRFVRD